MATEQSITQVITVIQAVKEAVMVVNEVQNPVNNARPIHSMPRSGSHVLRQPTFDWKIG